MESLKRVRTGVGSSFSLKSLFATVGAMSLLTVAVEVTLLLLRGGVGRVREVGFLLLLHSFSSLGGLNTLHHLPGILNQPFELGAAPVLQWLPLVLVTNLLVGLALTSALYLMFPLMAKAFPNAALTLRRYWLREQRLPLLILGVCCLSVFIRSYWFFWEEATSYAVTGRASLLVIVFIVPNLLLLLILRLEKRKHLMQSFRTCASYGGGAVLVVGLVAGAAGLALRQPRPAPAGPTSPNILLVSIDSLRSDHLHCYGYPRETSPTIDQLAAEGVLFTTVAAPTSWTLPSHVTLLTALAPEEHQVVHNWARLAPEALTLAEVLQGAGYSTAGFVSGVYVEASYGFFQGFDHFEDQLAFPGTKLDGYEGTTTSPGLRRLVREWLRRWNDEGRQRPFFVFLHMFDVHYDYNQPPPYDSTFDSDYRGKVTSEDFIHSELIHKDMDSRDLQHIISLYDGAILYTDHHLGEILEVLRSLGELDKTLIVVTADHGDEFFEHGEKGHHRALYDESILVPLVMRFPAKIPVGRRIKQQVRLMDVAPTILSLAGFPKPHGFGGAEAGIPYDDQDLTPLILGDPASNPKPLVAFGGLWGASAYTRTGTAKMILQVEKPDNIEVYDLRSDPLEQQNLAGQNAAADDALRQQLIAWRDLHSGRETVAAKMTPSAEQLEVLRTLGYIQ